MEQTLTPSANPERELEYIRKIITDSRRTMAEDGWPYIIWGGLVALGMIDTYLSILLQQDLYSGWVWIGLVLFGYVSMFITYRRQKRREPRIKSFIDRLQGAIWTAVGSMIGVTILLILLDYSAPASAPGSIGALFDIPKIHPFYICFFTSLLTGIGYFLSGFALDLKWLRNISFVWWVGGIVMFLWPSPNILGLYALMMILFQVVPGIILNRRYRAEAQEA